MARAEGQPFTQCETSSSALLAEKVPTIQQVRKLLFHSFKHSQGDANLQYNIFCYLRQFHPNWRIDESLSEAIVIASAQAILKHLPVVYPVGTSIPPQPLTHFPILETTIYWHTQIQFDKLKECFDAPPLTDPALLNNLAEQVILRDYAFRKGRPRDELGRNQRYCADMDPYLSYFCYYGVERHSTGLKEINLMYRAMVGVIEKSLDEHTLKKSNVSRLGKVIKCCSDQHPSSSSQLQRFSAKLQSD